MGLAVAAYSAAFAQETKIVDFDNQLQAATDPNSFLGARWFFSFVDTGASGSNNNIGWYQDPTMMTSLAQPNASSSIAGTNPSVPTGNGTDNLYRLRFAFMAPWDPVNGATPLNRNTDANRTFLRAFFSQLRSGVADLLNPQLDTTKKFRFDIYSVKPVRVALLISEAALTTTAIGAPGSTATPFELVGGAPSTADALKTTGSAGGYEIPAGTWTTVVVDLPNAATALTFRNFAGGNGALNPLTPNFISLSSLIFTPTAGSEATPDAHDIFIDNFRQGEPSGALTGTMTLNSYVPSPATRTALVEVFDGGGTLVQSYSGVALNAAGEYSIPNTLADGTYTVKASIEDGTWLRRATSVTLASNVGVANFVLPNGDIVDDGIVDIADYVKLALYFSRTDSDPDWNTDDGDGISPSRANLNGDSVIDIADYTALANAFSGADD